jgi:hypothetical protein
VHAARRRRGGSAAAGACFAPFGPWAPMLAAGDRAM